MLITNPLICSDMPDVDVLRRGDCYYMVSTTMFFMPGAPILKSHDLKNWEIVSYVFDRIEDNDIYELKNGRNAYGKGQWATSLTYHDGMYYTCFVCHDMKKTFIYYTDDIEKSYWKRYEFDAAFHDMSFLFLEGRSYLVYGNGDIRIIELDDDLSRIKEGGVDRILFSTPTEGIGLRCEGCRAIVRDGFIYLLFIEWPKDGNERRREVCYRAKSLDDEFERRIIMDDDCGYRNCGVAQGTIFDDEDGNWYCMMFQDHGAVGRIPYLMPMKWEDGWPLPGTDGKVPRSFEIPGEESGVCDTVGEEKGVCDTAGEEKGAGDTAAGVSPVIRNLIISDTFTHAENVLPVQFQWNHNPIPDAWSFTKRPGYLRLEAAHIADGLLTARNTLTERTATPFSSFTIEGDFSRMNDGDHAGLAAFMGFYGTIGLKRSDGVYCLYAGKKDSPDETLGVSEITGFDEGSFFLRIDFDFEEGDDTAHFYYSTDGTEYTEFGAPLQMRFTLDLFVGYRIGIFMYGTEMTGGIADFKNLKFSCDKK